MRYGVLVYGYAASVDDILMPRTYYSHDVLVGTDDMYPIDWAAEHYKYGQYVFPVGDDKVIFGVFVGEDGDALDIGDLRAAESSVGKAIAATKFFCDKDIDEYDCFWHVVTLE